MFVRRVRRLWRCCRHNALQWAFRSAEGTSQLHQVCSGRSVALHYWHWSHAAMCSAWIFLGLENASKCPDASWSVHVNLTSVNFMTEAYRNDCHRKKMPQNAPVINKKLPISCPVLTGEKLSCLACIHNHKCQLGCQLQLDMCQFHNTGNQKISCALKNCIRVHKCMICMSAWNCQFHGLFS